jgi:hypothetical protein
VDKKKGEPIMLSYKDFLIRQEQYKDLLREAERERLIRAAGFRQLGNRSLHRKIAGWLGTQMAKWGCKLQSYGPTPSAYCPQAAECQ